MIGLGSVTLSDHYERTLDTVLIVPNLTGGMDSRFVNGITGIIILFSLVTSWRHQQVLDEDFIQDFQM